MILFILVWMLVVIVFIKCLASEAKTSDEKIIEMVCEQVLDAPNEDILEPNLDLDGFINVLEKLYADYFTEEAFKSFIQVRYGDKYHVVANETGKFITIKAITVTQDKQNTQSYHFEALVEIEDYFNQVIPVKVLGHATLVNHKITQIEFLDQNLLRALAQ